MSKTDTTKTGTPEKPDPWRVPIAVAQIPETGLHRDRLQELLLMGCNAMPSLPHHLEAPDHMTLDPQGD